ncbi:hypothetical protein [Enterobacteria phage vB_EcoM_IME281]|uniref:Uncharacterized protein n=2 Tax=Dhakavirus TaxID=1914165 RepID=A0A2S1GP49_9CAUD|nr:hypothetical protein KNT84_gp144 [Enterobacteria phage vB_EcoM_IME281]YP_010100275.1 hypothetical protein KNU29_gp072 [Escherichia phage AnYang]AWD91154.1 hypothetical protein [Enterobacteria phage vB_EcoM_IME281]QAU03607.1 hypothetical protein [Escherichia phage AnYang]
MSLYDDLISNIDWFKHSGLSHETNSVLYRIRQDLGYSNDFLSRTNSRGYTSKLPFIFALAEDLSFAEALEIIDLNLGIQRVEFAGLCYSVYALNEPSDCKQLVDADDDYHLVCYLMLENGDHFGMVDRRPSYSDIKNYDKDELIILANEYTSEIRKQQRKLNRFIAECREYAKEVQNGAA